VPVDAFWSITLYNADGFMQQNTQDAYSVNSVSGVKNDDGSITVHLGGEDDRPNNLPIMDGWNYLIRLYQPRPEVLNGTWTFPAHESATCEATAASAPGPTSFRRRSLPAQVVGSGVVRSSGRP